MATAAAATVAAAVATTIHHRSVAMAMSLPSIERQYTFGKQIANNR